MIAAGSGTRIVIARRPVDFRKQADSLAALVAADLAQDPYLCVGRDYVAQAP